MLFNKMDGPHIMGIVNVTPDSFSGDGLLHDGSLIEAALAQGRQMVADGATILDVGGESTRPGATPVSSDEETRRVVPVLQALHESWPQILLSIDTMKPAVAQAALAAGATILNDVSGCAQDPAMRALAAQSGAHLVLMHNQARADAVRRDEKLGGEYKEAAYTDVVSEVAAELQQLAVLARKAGVAREKIILDPGIGFGKTPTQNCALINHLDALTALNYSVLLAASRKSFIGRTLNVPPEDRLEGTAAAIAIGVLRGASILRVHDVRFMARVARMTAVLAGA